MEIAAVAAIGLQAGGAFMEGQGKAAAYQYQEDRAQRMALAARTSADQTDSFLRGELQTTLGNINAIRAAANTSSNAPTALAISENERDESERQRRIRVGNLRAQATQYERDASYYSYAAGNALGLGTLNAFTKGISGLSGMRTA